MLGKFYVGTLIGEMYFEKLHAFAIVLELSNDVIIKLKGVSVRFGRLQ